MNTKGILGISLAAVFAIGITSLAYAGILGSQDYMHIDSADAMAVEDDFVFSANMNGTVPVNSNKASFTTDEYPVWGVAWVDDYGNFTGVTIHPNIVDSRQNPDHWHPHTGTFFVNGTNGAVCIATLESPNGGIDKDGEDITLSIPQKWSDVTDGTAIAGVSFFLEVNHDDCPEPIDVDLPGKGLKPHAVAPPLPGLEVIPIGDALIP